MFGWTSNHEYRLDERDRTATRPRDDVCTLSSGGGDLEGMGGAVIMADLEGIGVTRIIIIMMNHRFGGCRHNFSCFGTPQLKPLRQTLPEGNMKGLSKRFNRGTSTEHDIVPMGWILVVVLFG